MFFIEDDFHKEDFELIDMPEGWSPYLALEDASKLDDVRVALRISDLDTAGRSAHFYTLTLVDVLIPWTTIA